eukprot:211320-Amphidinium_carterae.1
MVFLAEQWCKLRSPKKARYYVDNKLQSEFKDDMLPLLQDMQAHQRLYLRQLAEGTATQRPTEFFDAGLFLESFLDRSLVQSNGMYSLPNGPHATFMLDAVDTKGRMLRTSSLPIVEFEQRKVLVPRFQALGEGVKKLPRNDPRLSKINR